MKNRGGRAGVTATLKGLGSSLRLPWKRKAIAQGSGSSSITSRRTANSSHLETAPQLAPPPPQGSTLQVPPSCSEPADPSSSKPSLQPPPDSVALSTPEPSSQPPPDPLLQATPAPNDQNCKPISLWGQAFLKLTTENQTAITERLRNSDNSNQSLTTPSTTPSIDSLIDLAQQSQEKCKEEASKIIKIGGLEIELVKYTSNIITWLTKFKEVGDTVVQYDPAHAALPWAAVRLLIQSAVSTSEEMAAMLAIVERISRLVVRCRVLETLYTPDNVGPELLKDLHTSLVELYVVVYSSIFRCDELFSANTAIRTIRTILLPGAMQGYLGRLSDCEEEVVKISQLCMAKRSAKADKEHDADSKKLFSLLEELKCPLDALLEAMNDKESHDLRDWVSKVQYGTDHEKFSKDRTPATCEWLVKRKEFQGWYRDEKSGLIILYGSPGAGKTYLTSKVIDYVKADLLDQPQSGTALAHFYCHRYDPDHNNAESILRSCIVQLSGILSSTHMLHTELRRVKKKCSENRTSLDFSRCKDLVITLIQSYPQTFIILDGLDECGKDSRAELLSFLNSLGSVCSVSKTTLKMFLSSRPEIDIKRDLASWPCIQVQAANNEGDILEHLMEQVQMKKHEDFKKVVEAKNLLPEIRKVLEEKSDGMFRWAHLQIEQLTTLRTDTAIRTRLGSLPKGLERTYDEIFKRIESNRDNFEYTLLMRSFQWVMCTSYPLTTTELLSAISYDPDSDIMRRDEPLTEEVLSEMACNLLEQDGEHGAWRFSHLSVAEYAQKRLDYTMAKAHTMLAKLCLGMLSAGWDGKSGGGTDIDEDASGDPLIIYSDNEAHKFLRSYAFEYWGYHARNADLGDDMLARRLKKFIGSPAQSSRAYQHWVSSYGWKKDYQPSEKAIFGICIQGLYTNDLKWWNDSNFDPAIVNAEGYPLLSLAIKHLHQPVWQYLLDCHAERTIRNSNGKTGTSPLVIAAEYNTEAVEAILCKSKGKDWLTPVVLQSALVVAAAYNVDRVKLLLQAGAKVNETSDIGNDGSALAAAAYEGNIEIVRLLLEQPGVDPAMELRYGRFGNALAAAAATYTGNTEIVRLLLELPEVDPAMELRYGWFGNALAAAAYESNIEIVRLLLEQPGVDPAMELRYGWFGSVLAAAAVTYMGNTEIVRLLLEQPGVDPAMELRYGWFGNALAAAAYGGEVEMVRLLLEQPGVDPAMELRYGKYGSALAAAALKGEVELIRLLLEQPGVDPTMELRYGEYGSALIAAAAVYKGNIEIIRFLLEQPGVDPAMEFRYGWFGSTLAAAAFRGNIEIIRLLLEQPGMDPAMELRYGRFGSALAAAAYGGNIEIIRLLLEQPGMDPAMELRYGWFGSVLAAAAAAYEGNIEIVRFLLELPGVDPAMELRYGEYGSTLAAAAASYRGNIEIIRFLLEQPGVDPAMELRYGRFGSALAAAAYGGCNIEIIRLLLELPGMDPAMELRYGWFGSTLAAAAYGGNIEIIRLLLEQPRVDPAMELRYGDYGSALAAGAAGLSYPEKICEVTKLFLENGGDLNECIGGFFGNALVAAISNLHKDARTSLVKMFIDKGADLNLKLSGPYRNALQAAAQGSWMNIRDGIAKKVGHECNRCSTESTKQEEATEMVKLLQEHGAEWDGDPQELQELLLSKGAGSEQVK